MYFMIRARIDDQEFVTVCDDVNVATSDDLLERAKGIVAHKFGHYIEGDEYMIELFAVNEPAVIKTLTR